MSQQQAAQTLRTRQVGDILAAQQYQEEAPSRDIQQQIRAQQLEGLKQTTPLLGREKNSDIAYREELTRQLATGRPIEQAHTEALTERIKQETQDAKDLGDLPRQLLEEKLAAARRENQSYVDFEIPEVKDADGNVVRPAKALRNIPTDLIARSITSPTTRGGLTEQNRITNARADRKEAESRADDSEDAESVLLGRKKAKDGGELNLLDPAAKPYADEFNRKSDKPYAYVWEENAERNMVWPNKPGLHRVDLPVGNINGKPTQLTPRLLTQMGRRLQPPKTLKEMIEMLQKGDAANPPLIKGKLPWQ